MSVWEDRVSGHKVNDTLTNLAERLTSEKLESEDTRVIDLVTRIRDAVSYAKTCIGGSIPSLVTPQHLNNIDSQIAQVLPQLNNFIADGNVAHLENTTPHIDNFIKEAVFFAKETK